MLVTAHEAGLWDDIIFVGTYPGKNRDGEDQGDAYSIAKLNPLIKVPTLALDTGQVVYGSQAVVECLDSMSKSGQRLYREAGPERWEAITRLAMAEAMFETTVQMVMEGWVEESQQRIALFEWIWPKIIRGLEQREAYCARGFKQFDIGQVAMLHAISYMDFRVKFYDAKDPLHPDFECFEGRPNLHAWWVEAQERPSVKSHYNVDFAEDNSAAFCQAQVQAVLDLQKEHGTQ